MEIGKDKFVTLKEDTHQYFDINGEEYKSVSSLLEKVKMPFDRQNISLRKAKSDLGPNATEQEVLFEQNRLLQSWDDTRDSSTDWGNYVHKQMESYFTIGNCDSQCLPAAQKISTYFSNAISFLPEVCCYNVDYNLAGTFDLGMYRKKGTKGSTTMIDLWDFKTNEQKGIEFDSAYIDKHGVYQPGMKFLLTPLDHLEQCNFNIYSLQLSLYALMIQLRYEVHIGRMGIIFINKQMEVTIHHVPFMKYEALELFKFSKEIKSLP